MSVSRITGKSFFIYVAGRMINVESASLSIEDGTEVAKTNGMPNGYVDGELSAQGELEVDTQNFNIFSEIAAEAGSWKAIPVFDIIFTASAGGTELDIEAFDNKLKINELLNVDPNGKEKSKHKITFDVTGQDFIKINGIPYADASELVGIVQ